MAFHRQQAFEAIRDLLNSAYSEDFQAFDYFTADTLTPEDAPDFYANRVRLLQQWLEDNAFAFSQAEQNYLVQQYQALETPMYVDYTTGWQQFYEFSPQSLSFCASSPAFWSRASFPRRASGKPTPSSSPLSTAGAEGFCQGGRRSSPAHRALLGALPPLRGNHPGLPGGRRGGLPGAAVRLEIPVQPHPGPGGSSHCPGWISRHPVSGPAVHVGLRQERLHGAGRRAALRSDLPARPDAGGYQHLTQQHFGAAAR
ncbi:MAG: hypothetical protein ACLSCQ_03535 [Evtepia gabavorous]